MSDQVSANPFATIDSRLTSIEGILAHLSAALTIGKPSETKFYTIAEASKKLGVAKITLYRNVQAKKIPSKKVGSRVMIPGSFIDK